MKKIYPFAVMDGNQNQNAESPYSVHLTKTAAINAAKKMNGSDKNQHFFACEWNSSKYAKDFTRDLTAI